MPISRILAQFEYRGPLDGERENRSPPGASDTLLFSHSSHLAGETLSNYCK